MKYKIFPIILIFLLINWFSVFFTAAYAVNPAVQYANIAHEAYDKRELLKAGEYYEKAYAAQKNKVYLDNAVTSYLSHAFDMSNEKKYDEGIKYCQKVFSIQPDNNQAKELLSDIYYTKGLDDYYSGNIEKAGQNLENALKYSVLPEQSQKTNEAIKKLQGAAKDKISYKFEPFSTSTSSTISNTIGLLEIKIYGKKQEKLPIMERVSKLEKDVFNQIYDNESLINRINRLKKAVLPELAQVPVNNQATENNYIKELIEQSGGTAKIFGEMPVKVFIDNAYVKNYHKYFDDALKAAMKEWEAASNGKIKFEITNEPQKANIKVVWTEYFEDFSWQPELKSEDISAQKQKIKYGKANTLVQIGSVAAMVLGGLTGVPIVGMVGSVGGSVASPILQYKSLNLDDTALSIKINTAQTSGMTKEQATAKIKQISLHQIGHAIGIYGHSPNPDDIMYVNFTQDSLSERDKNTLNEIYKNVK